MWRAGMWYDDERTTTMGYLRNGAIVLAGFLVTGVIFLVLQRSLDNMNKRISGTYNRAGETEGTAPTFAPINAPQSAYPRVNAVYSPVAGSYAAPSYANPSATPVGSAPVAAPVYNVPVAYSLFSSDAERRQARLAVSDLRVALKDFKDYNTRTLPGTLSGSAGSRPLTAITEDGDAGTVALDGYDPARQEAMVDRVGKETEALGSLLSLTAHPDRFPEPLRDHVGVVSRELRTYLQNVRYAVALPDERSRLMSLASQHLTRGETALQEMERAVGGTTGGPNIP
ncbi:MAG: hypothetical protein SFU56_13610 [Capsulimonadales bacterium]|nr:hypothetical protein [Capsulimonadales bacterium]